MIRILVLWSCLITSTAIGQNITFQQVIGTPGEENGLSALQTTFGEYVIAASYWDTSFVSKIVITKINLSGTVLWSALYSSQQLTPVRIIELTDNNFLVLGNTDSCVASNDMVLMKIDKSSGAIIWSKVYSGTAYDLAFEIQETADRGFVISALHGISTGGNQALLIKTDSMGIIQWSKIYSFPTGPGKVDVMQLADGNFLVGGYHYNMSSTSMDLFLFKIGTTGNIIWSRTYATTANYDEGASSVMEAPNGDIYVTGTRSTSAVYGELLIARFSSTGILIWAKSYGGSGVMQTEWSRDGFFSGGKIIAVGLTNSYTPGQNFYFVSADTTGNILTSQTFAGGEAWSVTGTGYDGFLLCGNTGANGFGGSDIYLVQTDSLFSSGCFETGNLDTFEVVALSTGSLFLAVSNANLTYGNCTPLVQSFTISDSLLCLTVGMPEITNTNDFILFPNPTDGVFTFNFPNEISKIEILDVLGKNVIIMQNPESSSLINLSDCTSGIYITKIVSGGTIYIQKLMLQK